MALNTSTTVSAITAALNALPITATESDRWTAVINALYTRIKADLVVSSVVAVGQHVTTTGTATTQTGATDSAGTATAGGGTGSIA